MGPAQLYFSLSSFCYNNNRLYVPEAVIKQVLCKEDLQLVVLEIKGKLQQTARIGHSHFSLLPDVTS